MGLPTAPVMPMPVEAPPPATAGQPVRSSSRATGSFQRSVATSSVPLASQEVLGRDSIIPLRRDEMPFSVFWPTQIIDDLRAPTMR